MLSNPTTIHVPLQTDEHGIIHVSNTRVTLDTVVIRYQQGDSPEDIHEGFDILPLNDIYAVISYYLANRAEVDQYIRHRQDQAKQIREEVEANYTPKQKLQHDKLLEKIKANQKDD